MPPVHTSIVDLRKRRRVSTFNPYIPSLPAPARRKLRSAPDQKKMPRKPEPSKGPSHGELAADLSLDQRRAWRILHPNESGQTSIRNHADSSFNWKRTSSETLLAEPDKLPIMRQGDLRIHVSPVGMEVWSADLVEGVVSWVTVEEGDEHPVLGSSHVLTFHGTVYMPRWISKPAFDNYRSMSRAKEVDG